tara:strand:+ start:966 stop:1922 length:957 start_codon:yes stop_codon:yes gene_type:complete
LKEDKQIINVYSYFKLIHNYRKYFLVFTISSLILGLIYLNIAHKYYKSETTIYHHDNNNTGFGMDMGSISAMMNMFSGGASSSSSAIPFSIPDIVQSRTLKQEILSIDWLINGNKTSLVDFWKIDGESDLEKNEIAIKKLDDLIAVELNETGLYIISVISTNSKLSALIANYISEYIIDYINTKDLSNTSKHREFIQGQVNNAKDELSKSEEILTEFYKQNVMIDNPSLVLEESRLQRNVLVNQQVYITLRQQFEIVTIEESKRDPVLTVIDSAVNSYEHHSPKSVLIILISLICGLSISFLSMYLSIFRKELKNITS